MPWHLYKMRLVGKVAVGNLTFVGILLLLPLVRVHSDDPIEADVLRCLALIVRERITV